MAEKGIITYEQLIFLIFTSRIVVTLTYLPALTSPPANQDVWLSELLSLPMLIILSFPVYLLWKRYPSQTIIQYSQSIAGIAGKVIGAFYVWFFIHLTLITLSQYSYFLTTAIMPETPFLFFIITLVIVATYAVRNGIEVICRLSELLTPIIMIGVITIVLLLIKDMDLKALTPVMENGLIPVLHGGFTIASRTVEIVGIAMLLPYLNDRQKVKRVFILSFTLIIAFFVIITITVITTFGVELAKNRSFPFFSSVGLVSIGNFLERIEAVHMGIWIWGGIIKISFYFYLAVLGISQLFNIKDYKTIVLPTGTLIIPLTVLISKSIVELKVFTS